MSLTKMVFFLFFFFIFKHCDDFCSWNTTRKSTCSCTIELVFIFIFNFLFCLICAILFDQIDSMGFFSRERILKMDGLQNESKREKAISIKSPKPTKTPNAKVKWNRKSNKLNKFSFDESKNISPFAASFAHSSKVKKTISAKSQLTHMFWAHNHIERCSNEQIGALCFSKLKLSRFCFGDDQNETFMSLSYFHLRFMYFACYNIFLWLVFRFSSNGDDISC